VTAPGVDPELDTIDAAAASVPTESSRSGWAAVRSAVPGFIYPLEIPVAFLVGMSFTLGVSPHAVFRSLIVAVVAVVVMMLVLTAILRDVHRAAIAMVLVYLLLISYGTLPLLLVTFAAVGVVIELDRLPTRRISWAQISGAVSTFMSILLVLLVVQGLMTGGLGRAVAELNQGGGLTPSSAGAIDPAKPDIYVIILDGYARPDTLQRSFGFDDGPFVKQLESRGFDFAADSHSNYPATGPTFVTMLNMAYLDQIPAVADVKSGDPASDGSYRHAINDNDAFRVLRGQGYQIVATGSGWEQLAIREADVYLDDGQINTFEAKMLELTGVGKLVQLLAPNLGGDQARGRIDSTFREIRDIAQTPSSAPRLVVSHVLAPHAPLVYGPEGQKLQINLTEEFDFDYIGAASSRELRDAYVGQVAYVNSQVLPTVDAILASARRPAVVVLMSDHGSRLDTAPGSTAMSPEADRNFFATLTPGHKGLFGASPTPVNLFPHLLDTYLGLDIPIQADRSFLRTWESAMEFTPLPNPDSP
jgi:hypothetical protein